MECKQVAAAASVLNPKNQKATCDVEEQEPTETPLRCPGATLWEQVGF